MVSLFQRIKTPSSETADDASTRPARRQPAVGDLLRARREELGLDLDDVGEMLRIKPIYLAALEQGRVQDLPGPTYAIGFIRAYAHHLGFDVERVLELYKAEADVRLRPDLALPVPLEARSLPGGPILLVALILALCGYGTWYYLSTGGRSRPERVAAVPAALRAAARLDAAPPPSAGGPVPRLTSGLVSPRPEVPIGDSPASAPAASPTEAASPPSVPATPSVPAAAPAPRGGDVAPATTSTAVAASARIDLRALADCWIQVRAADHSIVFSRVLKTGETYHVPRSGLFLRTGNAGALAISVDGKPAPAIGPIGTLRRDVALDPEALLSGTAVHG